METHPYLTAPFNLSSHQVLRIEKGACSASRIYGYRRLTTRPWHSCRLSQTRGHRQISKLDWCGGRDQCERHRCMVVWLMDRVSATSGQPWTRRTERTSPGADAPTRTRLRDRIWLSEVLAAPFARVYEHDDPNPRLDDVTFKDSPFVLDGAPRVLVGHRAW